MKIYIYILAIIAAFASASCSTNKSAANQARKKINAQIDSINAVKAFDAVKNMSFVLEAERVTFKHGGTTPVNSTTNFIMVKGDKATVQLASASAMPGFNGMGGFTLDGAVRNVRYSVSKHGDATLLFNVSGKGLSADITVRLGKNQTYGTASVDAAYFTAGMTVDGTIKPLGNAWVVKGETL